jgi:hypothetical protein
MYRYRWLLASQFWRWIDPIGQYFCFNLKNAAEAKDVSSWALRSVRSNSDDLFVNADDTARDASDFAYIHNIIAKHQF